MGHKAAQPPSEDPRRSSTARGTRPGNLLSFSLSKLAFDFDSLEAAMSDFSTIGKRVPMTDGPPKVTGT
ncbi:hypothetical protein WAI88_21340, partial [Acinetobacter baumannii]